MIKFLKMFIIAYKKKKERYDRRTESQGNFAWKPARIVDSKPVLGAVAAVLSAPDF